MEKEFRISSEIYHHGLRKDFSGTAYWGGHRFPMYTNSLGFRDGTPRDVALQPEDYRILFMGDSFTEGVGVKYEDSFVGQIAHELAANQVEVLNAGCVSYSPTIYYRKTKHLLEAVGLEFDELVVFLDVSDIHDEAVFYTFDHDGKVVFTPNTPGVSQMATGQSVSHGRLTTVVKANSLTVFLLDALKDWIEKGTWSRMLTDNTQLLNELSSSPRSAWTVDEEQFERFGKAGLAKASQVMERLDKLLDERSIPLTVVVYPWPTQILRRDHDSRHVLFWRQWCEDHDAQFLDLHEPFLNAGEPMEVLESYYIPLDSHWNADGHRLVASLFSDNWLKSRNEPAASATQSSHSTRLPVDVSSKRES